MYNHRLPIELLCADPQLCRQAASGGSTSPHKAKAFRFGLNTHFLEKVQYDREGHLGRVGDGGAARALWRHRREHGPLHRGRALLGAAPASSRHPGAAKAAAALAVAALRVQRARRYLSRPIVDGPLDEAPAAAAATPPPAAAPAAAPAGSTAGDVRRRSADTATAPVVTHA